MGKLSRQRGIDCVMRGRWISKMSIEGRWKRWGNVEGGGASLLGHFSMFRCGERLQRRAAGMMLAQSWNASVSGPVNDDHIPGRASAGSHEGVPARAKTHRKGRGLNGIVEQRPVRATRREAWQVICSEGVVDLRWRR
jgi:hypothetical protein